MSAQRTPVQTERHRLLHEKIQVEEELARLRLAMKTEIDTEPDEGDVEILSQKLNVTLIQILEHRLRNLNTALEATEKGLYGICARCNRAIEEERLAVKPEAIFCVNCQKAVEVVARPRRQKVIDWELG